MTTGPVTLDGMEPVLGQYDPTERWNGWLCPWIDAYSAVAILEFINREDPDGPIYAYDFQQGVLFVDDLQGNDAITDWNEPDEDGLYQLGAGAWIWSAFEPEEEDEPPARHLRAVPDLLVAACMYADTGNGRCGGPITQRGDGYDYCVNHTSTRLLHL